jgi:hypothetical protein
MDEKQNKFNNSYIDADISPANTMPTKLPLNK